GRATLTPVWSTSPVWATRSRDSPTASVASCHIRDSVMRILDGLDEVVEQIVDGGDELGRRLGGALEGRQARQLVLLADAGGGVAHGGQAAGARRLLRARGDGVRGRGADGAERADGLVDEAARPAAGERPVPERQQGEHAAVAGLALAG